MKSTPKRKRTLNFSKISSKGTNNRSDKENKVFKFDDQSLSKQLSARIIPLLRNDNSSVMLNRKDFNCVVESEYGKHQSINLKLCGRVQVWQVFDIVTSHLGIPATMKSLFSLYRANQVLRLNELLKARESVIHLLLRQL